MKNTIFYFIRHGEIDNPNHTAYGRARNLPLNELGKKQIRDLANLLKKLHVDPSVIYSSPLMRTRESAEIIKDVYSQPGLRIIFDDRLLEVDCPVLVGKPLKDIVKIDYYALYPDEKQIERPLTMAQRISEVVFEANKKYAGQTVFIVSHGDPLAFAIWHLLNPGEK